MRPVLTVDDVLTRAFKQVGYTPARERVNLEQYRTEDGIVRFVREVLGAEPAPYQIDILRALVREKRVAARGPHGLGKTALAAWVICWVMTVFDVDVKAPTTASAWRQLEKFLWPEIRKWATQANWHRIGLTITPGQDLLQLAFKRPGKEAFAVASDNPALIEGAHASLILYVFDEAKSIPAGTWDAAEGAFSGAGADTGGLAYALAISTPGEPSGRFYDIHARKPGYEDWWVRHVTLEEAIRAGRISREWVEQRRRQWGENSAMYQNRVLGEFAASGEDSVIPLAWVEAAVERWHACGGQVAANEDAPPSKKAYGLDVARYGDDKTALCIVEGHVVAPLHYWSRQGTMQTVGRVANLLQDKDTPIGVDVIGVGAGVFDRLRELGYSACEVNVAEKTDLTDASGTRQFINLRSAVWWMMRELLDPDIGGKLALPPDDLLTGDLVAPLWKETSTGRILVESKDAIKLRIGRSTDAADALAIALYAQLHGDIGISFT